MRFIVDMGAFIFRGARWSSLEIDPGVRVYIDAAGDAYTCSIIGVPLHRSTVPTVHKGIVDDFGQELADMIADLARPHLSDDDPQEAGRVRIFRPYVEVAP